MSAQVHCKPVQSAYRFEKTVYQISVERDAGPAALVTVTLWGGQQLGAAATRKAIDELKLVVGTEVWCLIKAVSIDARWLRSG